MISMCLHFPSYLDVASFDPSGPAQILQESHGSTNHLQYGQHVPVLPLVSPGFFLDFYPNHVPKHGKTGAQDFPQRALDVAEAEVAEVAEVLQWDGGMLFVQCLKHIFEARFSEF